MIFPPLCVTDCLCAPARRPKRNRSASMCHWKVAGHVEGCNVLPDGGP
jgi:hypothetical protein